MIIEEVEEFTAGVPVIDDGDLITNAELVATAKALANRTKYLKARTDPVYDLMTGKLSSVALSLASVNGDVANVPLPNESTPFNALNPPGVMGRGLARWIKAAHDASLGLRTTTTEWYPPVQCIAPALESSWENTTDANLGPSLTQMQVMTLVPVYLAIPLPGVTGFIKEIGLYVTGASGHAALPATRPRLRFISTSISGGVVTHNEVAAIDDPSANVAAYEVVHTIVLTGLNVAVERNGPTLWRYLRVTGEAGANALAQAFKIGGYYVKVSATA